jgi:hypothetical protein
MVVDRLASLFRDLEAHGPSSFALFDRGPINGIAMGSHVSDA